MKLKPQQYAETLIELSSNNLEDVASRFWLKLQKNKQYKDLPIILEIMETEAAKHDGKVLIKVYSDELMEENEMAAIEAKIKSFLGQDIVTKNFIKKNLRGGVIIKTDENIVDLSLKGKLEKLANSLEVKREQ
jgi:F-type H+-transporting ATPase subunit delta